MAVIDLADVEAIEEFPLSSCELPESTHVLRSSTSFKLSPDLLAVPAPQLGSLA